MLKNISFWRHDSWPAVATGLEVVSSEVCEVFRVLGVHAGGAGRGQLLEGFECCRTPEYLPFRHAATAASSMMLGKKQNRTSQYYLKGFNCQFGNCRFQFPSVIIMPKVPGQSPHIPVPSTSTTKTDAWKLHSETKADSFLGLIIFFCISSHRGKEKKQTTTFIRSLPKRAKQQNGKPEC